MKPSKVLVIGSGPILIGSGAEFDYAGTQACKALKEEQVEVILVNSNPATIMTDDNMADHVYIQPITLEALSYIIEKERPDGLLATLGGQVGLNMAMELEEAGILEKYGVKLLGTNLDSIKKAEDRQSFKQLMLEIEEPIVKSKIVHNQEEGLCFTEEVGYPVIIRPAYTMGGLGGGIAHDEASFKEILHRGLLYSPIQQVLIEESIEGWKEIEYEVMRDGNDTCIIVCNMENMDPVGIHTGDSIVVAPSQTLTDNHYHMLRTSAIKIIRALGIEGGCNVQYALHPETMEYAVIEVNPRVSRSSALASKATGYPIAKLSAKIALGLHLHEIPNPVTGKTMAAFEPTLDYVVVKIPKLPFDKFHYANRELGTQMQATGEVMAIDRTFESAFLKGVISLEGQCTGLRSPQLEKATLEEIKARLKMREDERFLVIAEALRRDITVGEIAQETMISSWFIEKIENIVKKEGELKKGPLTRQLLKESEAMGFTDVEIQNLTQVNEGTIDTLRRAESIYPVYKMVDTCGGEFHSETPYYYSCYEKEDENTHDQNKEKVIVVGSGPIRIGQGIEFDYVSVHGAWALQQVGYEAIMVNNNPETVSTDFDISDKLYFEPLYVEDVLNIVRAEVPKGVILQFGGQTAINLADQLQRQGVQILGTSVEATHIAEDRKRFDELLDVLDIARPKGGTIYSVEEGITVGKDLGYPLLVRPSYVIGGRGMQVVHDEESLVSYVREALDKSQGHPILIDRFMKGQELEVDAISDGESILIPGIMSHIEKTGVHSGDSFCAYPPQDLKETTQNKIVEVTKKLAKSLKIKGLMNIQFVVVDQEPYVIEVNPRASRTVPILSKVTGVPMVRLAVEVIMGASLKDLGYGIDLYPTTDLVAVKAPVFSFHKLKGVDVALTPEMKSTGEVLGIDNSYEKALLKAFMAAGFPMHREGKAYFSLAKGTYNESLTFAKQLQQRGYELLASEGTGNYLEQQGLKVTIIHNDVKKTLEDRMQKGDIQIVVNTPTLGRESSRTGFQIREKAQSFGIPCFTVLDTLGAYLLALDTIDTEGMLTYNKINYYLNEKE